ncbi:MAG: carboxylate-amine ligase [Elainellaceae cyanobacterium]
MSSLREEFTIGVEEEYQIIDPQTRHLSARSQLIVPKIQAKLGENIAQFEFRQSQIEIATPICRSLSEVRSQLSRLRKAVITTATQEGVQIAAAGTHPFSRWQDQPITPKTNYVNLAQHYQRLLYELVTFGCHIHIGIRDREQTIQIMNRARVWLSPMLALSASSPFWLGADTGHASYRTALISRLPMAGASPLFDSYREYKDMVQTLLATKVIQAPTQICWDLRPSERFPTLEFRIADMSMTIDEAVMLAGLARGLVYTCYAQAVMNAPVKAVRPELLRIAHWCAARWGIEAELIDVEAERSVPAQELIAKFLEFVRPALQEFGEWDEVCALTEKVIQHGTAATRQRQVFERTGSLEQVVDFIVQETACKIL